MRRPGQRRNLLKYTRAHRHDLVLSIPIVEIGRKLVEVIRKDLTIDASSLYRIAAPSTQGAGLTRKLFETRAVLGSDGARVQACAVFRRRTGNLHTWFTLGSPYIRHMDDHAAKLRQCMARFEGFLSDGVSAELAAVYLAEIDAAQAMLDVDDERRRRECTF